MYRKPAKVFEGFLSTVLVKNKGTRELRNHESQSCNIILVQIGLQSEYTRTLNTCMDISSKLGLVFKEIQAVFLTKFQT